LEEVVAETVIGEVESSSKVFGRTCIAGYFKVGGS
jgi:hypothetical protein